MRPLLLAVSLVLLAPLAPLDGYGGGSAPSSPGRLAAQTGAGGETVRISGSVRARFDHLDNDFRPASQRSSQLLLFRSFLAAEWDATSALTLGAELQDSRIYGADPGTPVGSSLSDPLDLLQGYLRVTGAASPWGDGGTTVLTAGRQTVNLGSGRQIERPNFANVVRSYTGAYLRTASVGSRDVLHAVAVVPVRREPTDRSDRADNVLVANGEEWHRRILALHYERRDLLGDAWPGAVGELYAHALLEEDTDEFATVDRRYLTPGFRIARDPAPGAWDLDLEGALRFGTRRASSAPDAEELDVSAHMLYLTLGRTFDVPARPRVAFQYYRASGDDDPSDDRYGRYERLFGSRRTDLNNTSIHGPLTPANLSAVGARINVEPTGDTDARLSWFAASLASETDAWIVPGLRDPSGASGSAIGHALDGRARLHLADRRLTLEVGGSALLFGDFAEAVPGGPPGERTLYGYTQVVWSF